MMHHYTVAIHNHYLNYSNAIQVGRGKLATESLHNSMHSLTSSTLCVILQATENYNHTMHSQLSSSNYTSLEFQAK